MKNILAQNSSSITTNSAEDKCLEVSEIANDLVQTVNLDGTFIYANPKWLETLGYKLEELPNLNIAEFIRTEQLPYYYSIIERVKQGNKPEYMEIVFKARDGHEIYLEGHVEGLIKDGCLIGTKALFHDVTRGKILEETYSSLVHNFPTSIYIIQKGILRFVNPSFLTLTGFSQDELLGKEALKMVHPGDRLFVRNCAVATLKAKKPSSYEFRLINKNGEVRWVMESVISIPYEGGRASLGTMVDLTERKLIEEAVFEAKNRYQTLFNSDTDYIYIHDLQGKILEVNNAACDVLGYSRSELLKFNIGDIISPNYLKQISAYYPDLEKKGYFSAESLQITRDGQKILVEVHSHIINYEHSKVILTRARDIRDRKKALEELQLKSTILEKSTEAILVSDLDNNFVYVNEAACAAYGYNKDEFESMNIRQINTPLIQKGLGESSRKFRALGELHDDLDQVRKDGSIFPVDLHTHLVQIGSRQFAISAVRDITERKKLENELRQSMEKYRLLVDNLTDFVIEIDLKGLFTFVNPAYCKLVGKSEEEVVGKPAKLFVNEEDLDNAEKNLENLYHAPYTVYTEHRVPGPGGIRWVAWKTKSVIDEQGNIKAFTSVGRDITESKQAKEELEKANQRLMELDKLKDNFLSTVSHELRTPLTSIKSFAEILLSYDEDRATQREFLGIINEESDRLTRLINDFLDLSKIQAGRMQWKNIELSPAEVIKATVNIVRPLIEKEKLSLNVEIEPDLPHILSDKDRIEQVVTNILGNAVKFTPKGGSITVKAWSKTAGYGEQTGQKDVIVSITDTGIGIAPEHHQKIFENFGQVGDVLKDKPKGTGLGLPICKKIIEYYKGKIWLESAYGKGSTFYFSLPAIRTENSIAPDSPVSLSTTPEVRNKVILVVDDEPNIRRFIQHELTTRGHRVIEASGGKEAVDLARKFHPDLITLDIAMPDLNGFDVTTVLKNDPDTKNVPILIISVVEDMQKAYRLGANDYVTKPISIETLLQRVNRLLKGSQKNILIVDDDEALSLSVDFELRKRGFSTEIAHSGRQALDHLGEYRPSLIVLDIKMPEMDGYEVIKILKNDPRTVDIPVVILTGIEIDGGRVKALSIGAADYLNKSEGLERLFETIEHILGNN